MKKSLKELFGSLGLVCVRAMPLCVVWETFAITQYTKGDFTYSYTVGTGEAQVDKYSGSDSSVNIPSSFTLQVGTDNNGLAKFETFHVTRIAPGAFRGNQTITSVSWPSSLKTIDGNWAMEGYYRGGAFEGCTNLQDIPSLSGITKISLSAFEGCTSLKSVTIPSTVTSLDMSAFQECTGLKTAFVDVVGIRVPSGLFRGCTSLESIVLGDGVVGIAGEFRGYVTYASWPFFGCSKLQSVSLGCGITALPERFVAELQLLERVTSSGTIGIVGDSAFYRCTNLIEFPSLSAVTDIGRYAFYGCSKIETFQFGVNLKSIGERAFYNCTNAFTFAFAGAPPSVGSSAFYNVKNGAVGTYTAEYAAEWDAVIDNRGYWKGLKMKPSYPKLTASDGTEQGGIEVTWTDDWCEQHELFRSDSANGQFKRIAVVTGKKYFDSSVKWGQRYWYYVNRVSGQKGSQSGSEGSGEKDSNVDDGYMNDELPKITEVDVGELWLTGEGPYYCFLKWNDFDKDRYYVSSISFNLMRSGSRVPVWTPAPKVSLSDSNQFEVFDVSQNGAFLVPKGAHGQHLLEVTWEVSYKDRSQILEKDKQPCKEPCVCNDVKVFFHKYEMDGDIPNWFRYWRRDGTITYLFMNNKITDDPSVIGGLLLGGFIDSPYFTYDSSMDNAIGRCRNDECLQKLHSGAYYYPTPSGFPRIWRLSGRIGRAYSLGMNAAGRTFRVPLTNPKRVEVGSEEVGYKAVAAVIAHELQHGEIAYRTYGQYDQKGWLFIGEFGVADKHGYRDVADLLSALDNAGYNTSLYYSLYYNAIAEASNVNQFVTDFDGDGIADVHENGEYYGQWGFKSTDPDTYNARDLIDQRYAGFGDNEILAFDAEKDAWKYIGSENRDWAWPGYNIAEAIKIYKNRYLMSLMKSEWDGVRDTLTSEAQRMSRKTKTDMSAKIQAAQGRSAKSVVTRKGLLKSGEEETEVVEDAVSYWHGTTSAISDILVSTGDVHVVSCAETGMARDGMGRVASLGWSLALTNATEETMTVKLRCYLTDGATNALAWAATNVECAVGLTMVEMRFEAEDVFLWNASRLMLYAVTIESSVGDVGWMVSEQTPCALTAAEYSAADFANDKGRIVPSSIVVDVTSEGVTVSGEVVRVSGDAAQIYASLTDTNGLTVTSAMIEAPGVGTNVFSIFFPGDELYRLAKPLPYLIDSLRLAENGETVYEINAAGTVEPEDVLWFRPADLTIHALAGSGAWAEPLRGADGLCSQITYSFVVSNAEDTVKACHVSATLLGTNEEHVCSLNLPVALAAGLNTVSMSFSSIDMKGCDYDGGVYHIGNVFIESDDGNGIEILHTDGNSIAVVNGELGGVPFTVKGTPQYREAEGTNFTAVVVTVDVARPDTITASALLVDGEGKCVAMARISKTFNEVGEGSLTLTFDPAEVRASGRSGPYTISHLLLKSGIEGVKDIRLEEFEVRNVLYLEQVAPPTFSPATKTVFFRREQPVTISCATDAAEIRYTLDGSEPTASSKLYDGAFIITNSVTVKAKAFVEGMRPSATAQAEYMRALVVGANLVQDTAPESGVAQTVSVHVPGTYSVSFDYTQGGDVELRLSRNGTVYTIATVSATSAGSTNLLFDISAAGDYELTVYDPSSGSSQAAEVSNLSIAIPDTPENKGRFWIYETEDTYCSTGEWIAESGFTNGKMPINEGSTFTPYTSSIGDHEEITVTMDFEKTISDRIIDYASNMPDCKAYITMVENSSGEKTFRLLSAEHGEKIWKDVYAEGMTEPTLGVPYTFKFILDYTNKVFSVSLVDNEREIPLKDGTTSIFSFPDSRDSKLETVAFGGGGNIISLLGNYSDSSSGFAEGDVLRISDGSSFIALTDAQARWLNSMGAYELVKAKIVRMGMEDFMVAYLLNLDLTKDGSGLVEFKVSEIEVTDTEVHIKVQLNRVGPMQTNDGGEMRNAPLNGILKLYGGVSPQDKTILNATEVTNANFLDGDSATFIYPRSGGAKFFRCVIELPAN